MPVTVTGTSTAARCTNIATSLTFSHTTTGQPLYVDIHLAHASATISAVTFNGVALAQATRKTSSRIWEVWVLAAPGTATANVVITWSSLAILGALARNVSGGPTTGPFLTNAALTSGSSTAPSTSIVSAAGSLVLDCVGSSLANQTFTVGPGQTLNAKIEDATANYKVAGSAEAGAASVTMSWTLGTSAGWWLGVYTVSPASAERAEPFVWGPI